VVSPSFPLSHFFCVLSLSFSLLPPPSPHCCPRCTTTTTGHHLTLPPLPKGAACTGDPPQQVSNQNFPENCRKHGRKRLELQTFCPATSNLQNLLGFKAFHPINLVVSSYFNFKYSRRRIEVGDFRFRKIPAPIFHDLI
jgi:hypothetical protein